MRFRWIGRHDRDARILRLFRLIWSRSGGPGSATVGWSSKLTVAISTRAFYVLQRPNDVILHIGFIRLHWARSFSGWHT